MQASALKLLQSRYALSSQIQKSMRYLLQYRGSSGIHQQAVNTFPRLHFSNSLALAKQDENEDNEDDGIANEGDENIDKEPSNNSKKNNKSNRKKNKNTPSNTDQKPVAPPIVGANSLVEFNDSSNANIQGFFNTPTPPVVEVIPLYKKPVFPGTIVPVVTADQGLINNLIRHGSEDRLVGLFLVKENERSKENSSTITSISQIEPVGVLARVTRIYPGSKYGATVLFASIRRIIVENVVEDAGRLTVKISEFKEQPYDKNSPLLQAYVLEIISSLKELAALNPFHKEQLMIFIDQLDLRNPSDLADVAALLTTPDASKLQEILSCPNVEERIRKALNLLKGELETIKIQAKIQKNLEEKVNQTQRKFYLNEQLKLIKKELGLETDEKEALVSKYMDRLKEKKIPEAADKVIKEEMAKLQTLEPSSSEYNVCRNYLDWLTVLPWGVHKQESFDIKKAQVILDEDHFGLKKLKERILEFIAVGKLKGTVTGKIICLVGPPGVGKTSIGKSVARALNREFYRFSVGGMSDVAEIKGHRRTYIGAMPGKLMQVLKLSNSSNPVIMIDEIDKLGKGHGDPASALLEVLDPEQNNNFLDHYLDVPFDLSKVLFICTANVLDTIPRPLLDRMEVLRLSGYILEEKLSITKKYLIPKVSEDTGIKSSQVVMSDEVLTKLIREYCREAGVRNLQQTIEKVFRKCALKVASGHKGKITITEDVLEDYLGKPRYNSDRYYVSAPVGVTMGLAWTEMGGSTLYIETSTEVKSGTKEQQSGGGLRCTGKMGEVMKESTSIAYTYAKKFLHHLEPNNTFFENNAIHMHIPEGATPKDGPSAGITMVTSLLSLALNQPVKHNLSMTGEITLTGKVLEIGGVKEKIIAAKRSGVVEVILPDDNRKDWEELDEEIRSGINVHFADYYEDVFKIAFGYDKEANQRAIEDDQKKYATAQKKLETHKKKK